MEETLRNKIFLRLTSWPPQQIQYLLGTVSVPRYILPTGGGTHVDICKAILDYFESQGTTGLKKLDKATRRVESNTSFDILQAFLNLDFHEQDSELARYSWSRNQANIILAQSSCESVYCWLIKRVTTFLGKDSESKFVRFYFGGRLSPVTHDDLWSQTRSYLMLSPKLEVSDICKGISKILRQQNLIFIFEEIQNAPQSFLTKDVLEEFLGTILSFLKKEKHPNQGNLTLFFVECPDRNRNLSSNTKTLSREFLDSSKEAACLTPTKPIHRDVFQAWLFTHGQYFPLSDKEKKYLIKKLYKNASSREIHELLRATGKQFKIEQNEIERWLTL